MLVGGFEVKMMLGQYSRNLPHRAGDRFVSVYDCFGITEDGRKIQWEMVEYMGTDPLFVVNTEVRNVRIVEDGK